jgi:AraC family transcriptional regulator of adaptative response / DNA-3-methyladenine glycosylase II
MAEAAGFRSVRDMNRVVKQVFRFTPRELRDRRRDPTRLVADGGLELRLPYRPPLAWDALLQFLAPRATPGVEAVDLEASVYRRTTTLDGAPAVIEVRDDPDADALVLRVHVSDCRGLVHLVAQVRRMFDLDADPGVIDAHLARDVNLRPLVRARPGLRVPGALDPVELGVRAILGQQVTVAHATRLAGRLVARHGRPVPGLDALGLTHLFPTAPVLARARLDDVGLPAARATAVRAFAAAGIPLDGTLGLDRVVDALRAVPGIGAWTAEYVAMRAAGERDAFPAGDLGLRHALGEPDAPVPAAAARAAVEGLRPWRAYAAMHLWLATAGSRPAQTRQIA